jgi:hypothetical protein
VRLILTCFPFPSSIRHGIWSLLVSGLDTGIDTAAFTNRRTSVAVGRKNPFEVEGMIESLDIVQNTGRYIQLNSISTEEIFAPIASSLFPRD